MRQAPQENISSERRRRTLDNWARWACCLALLAGALYSLRTYAFLLPAFKQHSFFEVVLWDSQVFSNAGEAVALGRSPYSMFAAIVPFNLPFFSAPVVAAALGLLYSIFGDSLAFLLKVGHLAAVILTPLLLTRMFIGRSLSELAWGYGLFLFGLHAFGVSTVIDGNFGSILYLAIFAAMAQGLSTGRWFWFHVAVAIAVQVKPPYGLLWVVPILSNGWSWRQVAHATISAVAAASVFLISYFTNPDLFREWINMLVSSVERNRDFGYSVYGTARTMIGMRSDSILPYALHIGTCIVWFVFLLRDRTTGKMKAAALTAFAILANPRMKDYDVAFAVIPVVGIVYAALVTPASSETRRAVAVGAITLGLIAWHKASYVPIMGPFTYTLAVAAGILCLALLRPRTIESASPP